MRSVIAWVACAIALGLVNYSIAGKERQLESGRVVYLELAPVDPRSLMQGDYMALRFQIANAAQPALRGAHTPEWLTADGRLVATLDANSVGTYRRLDDGSPLGADEVLMRYRVRDGVMKFATNAFFFKEGTASRYLQARYGEFRVSPSGDLLLTGLRDKDLQPL